MMFSATDIISRSAKRKLLTDEKRAILRKQLSTRLAYIEKNIGTKEYVVTQTDLKDPEFNLMLTGMYLSQLLGEELEAGKWRLDKVALRYNQGYYVKMPANTKTTDLLLAGISGEGYHYVRKIVGKGGFLELLTA
jgi:soluble lytic murein transglycosylase-like protein